MPQRACDSCRLFHWRVDPDTEDQADYLVMAGAVDIARAIVLADLDRWKWQDPERFLRHYACINTREPYVGVHGRVIAFARGFDK